MTHSSILLCTMGHSWQVVPEAFLYKPERFAEVHCLTTSSPSVTPTRDSAATGQRAGHRLHETQGTTGDSPTDGCIANGRSDFQIMINPSPPFLLELRGCKAAPTWTNNCVLYVNCSCNFEWISGLVEIQEAIEKTRSRRMCSRTQLAGKR